MVFIFPDQTLAFFLAVAVVTTASTPTPVASPYGDDTRSRQDSPEKKSGNPFTQYARHCKISSVEEKRVDRKKSKARTPIQ